PQARSSIIASLQTVPHRRTLGGTHQGPSLHPCHALRQRILACLPDPPPLPGYPPSQRHLTPVGPDSLGVCANKLAMPAAGGSLRWLGLLALYRGFLRSRRMTSIMATTTTASATPSTAPGDSTNKETAITTMT